MSTSTRCRRGPPGAGEVLRQVPRRHRRQRRGRRGPARPHRAPGHRRRNDPFGRYVHEAARLGVDDRWVTPTHEDRRPRSPSARSSRRTTSRCTSTAGPRPRTWRSTPRELDLDAIRDGPRLLDDRHRPDARSPAARTHARRLAQRAAGPGTPSSTSTGGPMFWTDPGRRAAPAAPRPCARHRRGRQPRRVRDRHRRPRARTRAADALLDRGRRTRRRQAGPHGRPRRAPRRHERPRSRRSRSRSSTASAPVTRSAAPSATACSPAGTWSGSCGYANAAGAHRRLPAGVLLRDAHDRRGRDRARRSGRSGP